MGINLSQLVEDVQEYLQDNPMLNVLIRTEEFTPGLIKLSVRMMVDHFNQINWRSLYVLENFPEGTFNIQMYGTIFHLLTSAAALQTRNHLPYSDAGLTVAQFAKSGEYLTLANHFKGIFEQQALALKYEMNLEMGWGGVPSEYSYYGGYASFNGNST